VQSSVLGLIAATMGIAPRLVPFLVVLLAVLLFLGGVTRNHFAIRDAFARSVAILGIVFGAFALLSALWAEDLAQAAQSAGLVLLMILSGVYTAASLSHLLARLPEPRRRRFLRAVAGPPASTGPQREMS
jgi:uncharacterized membrane protein YeiB